LHFVPYGAAREVTGSMHLLFTGEEYLMLDCGLFQGRRKKTEAKNKDIPFDPGIVHNIILTHAHIDHCGRTPLLVKKGYPGRILATRASADASAYLLRDSAHIHESDARYLNYKTAKRFLIRHAQTTRKKNRNMNKILHDIRRRLKIRGHHINDQNVLKVIQANHLPRITPLYTPHDAEMAIELIEGYPYRTPIQVGRNTTLTFLEAGHILGSALTLLTTKGRDRQYRVLFTGDLGRFHKPIIKDPCTSFPDPEQPIDLLIMESTYGDRFHEPVKNLSHQLQEVLNDTWDRGGSVIIPSFAFGRTQEIIYYLHSLANRKAIPRFPIYVDSPLATDLTRVFGEHPEVYDRETHRLFLSDGENPFHFDGLTYVDSLEQSVALCKDQNPKVVISASGMCEGGRILHYLRYHVHNARDTILFVGYMAKHTLGRRILDLGTSQSRKNRQKSPPIIPILGKEYPLKARVVELGGFSAHADQAELLDFIRRSELKIRKIALVHGEKDQMSALKKILTRRGYSVEMPRFGQTVKIQ